MDPPNRISYIGIIWKFFPSDPRIRQGNIQVSALPHNEVGKIVRCRAVSWLAQKNLVVELPCALKVIFLLVNSSQKESRGIQARIFRESCIIFRNRIVQAATTSIQLAQL